MRRCEQADAAMARNSANPAPPPLPDQRCPQFWTHEIPRWCDTCTDPLLKGELP